MMQISGIEGAFDGAAADAGAQDPLLADVSDSIGSDAALAAPATSGGSSFLGRSSETEINRTGRAAATWASSTLFTVATTSVAFFTTPLLLRYLGQERLGAYRAAAEWMGYLSLLSLGITPALGVLMLRARTTGTAAETASVFRTGLFVTSIIAIVSAVAAVPVAFQIPRLVQVSAGLRHELVICTLVSAVSLLFLPFQMSRMVAEAEQRGYWINLAHTAQAVAGAVLSVVLAKAGLGLTAQSLAVVLAAVVGTVIYFIPTWKWYFAKASASTVRSITPNAVWRLSWPLALSGLGIRLNVMTDSLVVGYMLGPIAVFHLFATQRAISLFGGIVNGTASASWAALAELRLTGQQDRFISGILELTRLITGVGVALTGTVCAFNNQFVRLWVGSESFGGDLLGYATAVNSVLQGFIWIYLNCLDAAGEAASRIKISLFGAAGNLVISILLVRWIGLPGVVIGTFIAILATDSWINPLLVSRRFGVPIRSIVLAAVLGSLRGLPMAVVAAVVARVYRAGTWLHLFAEATFIGMVSLVYVYGVVLNVHERRQWTFRVGRLLSGRR